MSDDLFETRDIPDQPSYWDGLASRVISAATAGERDGLAWVGARPWCVPITAAIAAAAVMLGVVTLHSQTATEPSWAVAFATGDGLAQTVITASAPPSITELLSIGGVRIDGSVPR